VAPGFFLKNLGKMNKMTPIDFYKEWGGYDPETEIGKIVTMSDEQLFDLMDKYGRHCQEPGWISVEEQLPTDAKQVLVVYKIKEKVFTGVDSYMPHYDYPCFYGFGEAVTHWAPLPSAFVKS
jgi:Protein of unknown function (DUF551)